MERTIAVVSGCFKTGGEGQVGTKVDDIQQVYEMEGWTVRSAKTSISLCEHNGTLYTGWATTIVFERKPGATKKNE